MEAPAPEPEGKEPAAAAAPAEAQPEGEDKGRQKSRDSSAPPAPAEAGAEEPAAAVAPPAEAAAEAQSEGRQKSRDSSAPRVDGRRWTPPAPPSEAGAEEPAAAAAPVAVQPEGEDKVALLQAELEQVKADRDTAKAEKAVAEEAAKSHRGEADSLSALLRAARAELQEARSQLEHSQETKELHRGVASTQPTMELPEGSTEDQSLLMAAYQQISVLNTQMAHLYTELTMARTEVQQLRSMGEANGDDQLAQHGDVSQSAEAAHAQSHNQQSQIAALVGDIRHLQLDLEYHQQKLDEMLGEKVKMTKEIKQARADLAEARLCVEERDQMLKHKEVDVEHLKEELARTPRPGEGGGGGDPGMLVALRSEAAAKDSALIVSHYELHKEKLMRDRLEQKNAKLMERMQKLMMVVETMRKENLNLERSLQSRESLFEAKEARLRQAKQLKKERSPRGGRQASVERRKQTPQTMWELEGALPPLTQRSVDSAGGRRPASGASTPRTPRSARQTAPSPYMR